MSQNEREYRAGFSPGLGYALNLSEVPDSTQSSSRGDGYTAAVTAWRDGGAASRCRSTSAASRGAAEPGEPLSPEESGIQTCWGL